MLITVIVIFFKKESGFLATFQNFKDRSLKIVERINIIFMKINRYLVQNKLLINN